MKRICVTIIVLISSVNILYAQLSVVFNGDTTEIWDKNFSWNCGGKFIPIIYTSQDTIYITERDTSRLEARCNCNHSVCTKFIDLDTGTYTAMVIRQWADNESFPVGSVNFTITKTPTKPSQVTLHQLPCGSTSADEDIPIPNSFLLLTNYPNPFNPNTIIRYNIPNKSHVVLVIYNLSGQQIATLVNEEKRAGSYDINYDASHLSSGMYICHLSIGGTTISKKMILIK
jgi:hypothetical protein